MLRRIVLYTILSLLFLIGIGVLMQRDRISEVYEYYFGEPDSREIIAEASETKGRVRFKLPRRLIYKKLRDEQKLRYFDTITTDANSSVLLSFKDGLQLELGPNTVMVLEKPEDGSGGIVLLSFLRGRYKVRSQGNSKSVIKGTKALPKIGTLPEPKLIIEEEVIPEVAPPVLKKDKLKEIEAKRLEREKRQKKETLPDSYISGRIKLQRPFFNRCYAQHLRLNPNATGRIQLQFVIQPTGKVADVNIVSASIEDPRLQQCTKSIVERVEFRSFKGDPIVVTYPINFE